MKQQDYTTTRSLYREGLALRRESGDRWGIVGLLGRFACLEFEQSRLAAEDEALRAGERHPERDAWSVQDAARRAARLIGAAEALEQAIGSRPEGPYDRQIRWARDVLGEEAFAAAWAEGRAMTMEQAVAYALDKTLPQASPSGGIPSSSPLARVSSS